jgi:hypothetical protein
LIDPAVMHRGHFRRLCRQKAVQIVDRFWPAIEIVAQILIARGRATADETGEGK